MRCPIDMLWKRNIVAVLFGGLLLAATGSTVGQDNMAEGRPYRLTPAPNYSHCTDAGDATDLTDGQTTTAHFWTQSGTIGWQRARYASVTVDLGAVEPIAGVSLTTAAGTAGVTWPLAVFVLVSDDGESFYKVGELVSTHRRVEGPFPAEYAIRCLEDLATQTHGRYVQFVLIPPAGGPYLFTDEVEVFRGDPDLLDSSKPSGEPLDAESLFATERLRAAILHRFDSDAAVAEYLITEAAIENESARQKLLDEVDQLRDALQDSATQLCEDAASFRAVLPMCEGHAELFAIQAEAWRLSGHPALSAEVANPWDPLMTNASPGPAKDAAIVIHAMQGEARTGCVNLFNATDRTSTVRLRFEDLESGAVPEYVSLSSVEWTDTSSGVPVASALVPCTPTLSQSGTPKSWIATVHPGLVRQVWIQFHPQDLEPGEYEGTLVVESDDDETPPIRLPVRFHVWPFQFPEETTLLVGGWSYMNGEGRYGTTPENRDAVLEYLQACGVNSPWATSDVMRSFELTPGDPPQFSLDTKCFDDWIDQWPDARRYMVFLSIANYSGDMRSMFGDAELGSTEFDQAVGTWISSWVAHLRTQGVEPNQLGLLIHDEPHEGSDISSFLAWSKAIRAAEPDVLIWEDPTYRDPAAAPPELFESSDVLCPNRPMWLSSGEPFEQFYRKQRLAGKELQFYSCSGPAMLLDPYAYYRLQAWEAWREGATGSYFWAFTDNSGASSWNPYFAKAGPYTPLFIDDLSMTPGKQMEAVRESVQDFEYLVMLRDAIKTAEATVNAKSTEDTEGTEDAANDWAVLTNAKYLLETSASRVLYDENAWTIHWHDPKNRDVADDLRIELLEVMTALDESILSVCQ